MKVTIDENGKAIPLSINTYVSVKRIGKVDKIYEYYKLSDDVQTDKRKKGTVNETKLDNNLIRAKSKIKEYALCNSWTYFCTLTLAKEKGDRYNLKEFQKRLAKWINNYNTRFQCSIKYVLIPEYHGDGAIHFHGLIENLPKEHLSINEYGYLDWERYKKSFGYISISVIRDNVRIANYITKYLTKDMVKRSYELGQHLYICSKGLKSAEIIYQEQAELTYWDYENEFCRIKEIDNCKEDYSDYIID